MTSRLKHIILTLIMVSITNEVKSQSIPFEISKDGFIVIKTRINGIEGNFILDTGAGITLITKNFASKIKGINILNRQYTAFRATGEKITADLFKVGSISVGNIIDEDVTVTILDMNVVNVDGLLSLMFFRNRPFTINYKDRIISFENKKTLKKTVINAIPIPIQFEESRDISLDIFAYFNIGNFKLQLLIDSGAGDNVFHINSTFMHGLKIDPCDSTKVKTINHTSEFNPDIVSNFYKTTIPFVSANSNPPIKYDNPQIVFIDNLIYDGTTSLNWLGNYITIDLSKKLIFIKN